MKSYYVLSNGRVMRKDNTLYIENAAGQKKPIPVEDVDSLYLYGEVDVNTKLLVFLGQKHIPLHVFNYYGFYSGSYYPREYLHSGYLLVHQVRHYSDPARRLALSREMVRASAHSILRNVAYYDSRRAGRGGDESADPAGEVGVDTPSTNLHIPTDPDTEEAVDAALVSDLRTTGDPPDGPESASPDCDPFASAIDFEGDPSPLSAIRSTIQELSLLIEAQETVDAVRGIEGKMRERYYQAWRHILTGDWVFHHRVRRPPDNEVNALISFGNSVLYTACLSELYRTQLTPTISYLHEPGARRFSLALDLSEIFKPLIVDRAIFRLINTNQLRPEHFDRSLDGCYLADAGRRLFLAALEERMAATIHHRRLGRHVSYRHLIRLECYKLIRHLTDVEPYHAFRAWW
jgi:CRISP-associated protein Cas1